MSDPYQDFLVRKVASAPAAGIKVTGDIHPAMKPFQRDLVRWALRGGRRALFAGTGLGKTLMELAWATEVARHTQGQVLIPMPLAVAEQTIKEAAKFDIAGVSYAPDKGAVRTPITITNYDRFEKFDMGAFAGIAPDEASIIKNQDGALRAALTDGCRNIPFRLPCSATPAPNDFTEIGQQAEFLGIMSAKEMLAMYFVHDGSIRASEGSSDGWRLKRHAERDFWRWVASWAALVRHPRDLGYDEPGYDLPPLIRHQITVPVEAEQGFLFATEAQTLQERIRARKSSVQQRVATAARLVNSQRDRQWLIWCHLNEEADLLERQIPDALQVKGAHDRALKRDRLLGFCDGRPPDLISKPSIAGFGLNYQHCHSMVFVGLSDSFEQIYQAIRRCWRFGQTRPVDAYFIAAETEGAVVRNIEEKEARYERMADGMASHCREFVRANIRGETRRQQTIAATDMRLPPWLTANHF